MRFCVIWALALLVGRAHAETCDFPGAEDAVARFSKILTFKTVSAPDTPTHALHEEEFHKLHAFLAEAYPLVWSRLQVETVGVGNLSLLITWPGRQPALRPALMISHIDVVPVPEQSLKDWTHPPFSGAVSEGFVWGRGALDVKVTVITLLEAASALLAHDWAPHRTLLFAFGQDEEVGGAHGAARTAALLQERGVELDIIWDEGSSIMSEGVPGLVGSPVALIATAEKGYQSVKVHIKSPGGHSSMPPIDGSSVGAITGRILTALEASPPPVSLVPPVTEFVKGAAPYAPAWIAPLLALADRPPFKQLVAHLLSISSAEAAAQVRTTVAPTRLQAGVADNVLPQQGLLNLNFRLLPGHTVNHTLDYLRSVIGSKDMLHVELELGAPENSSPASAVSPSDGPFYSLLADAIRTHFQDDAGRPVAVLPFLLPGMTDSRRYGHLSRNGILRFMPTAMAMSDLKRVHGTNERLALDVFRPALCFTRAMLQRLGDSPAAGESAAAAGSLETAEVHAEL